MNANIHHDIPLVFYHARCLDGFGAAYAVWHRYHALDIHCQFVPVDYSHAEPPVSAVGRTVYVLDFGWPGSVLWQLVRDAHHVTWIDHHAPSWNRLDELRTLAALDVGGVELDLSTRLCAVLDSERSGAVLAWRHMYPAQSPTLGAGRTPPPVPPLLSAVQDHDLHRFELSGTRADVALLSSYEHDFLAWHELAEASRVPDYWSAYRRTGVALIRAAQRAARDVLEPGTRYARLGAYLVPAAPCPRGLTQAVTAIMLQGLDAVVAVYQDEPGRRKWSVRSRSGGSFTARDVAQQYGGEGHEHAAGFYSPLPDGAALVLEVKSKSDVKDTP